jgi:hypothetical protein
MHCKGAYMQRSSDPEKQSAGGISITTHWTLNSYFDAFSSGSANAGEKPNVFYRFRWLGNNLS